MTITSLFTISSENSYRKSSETLLLLSSLHWPVVWLQKSNVKINVRSKYFIFKINCYFYDSLNFQSWRHIGHKCWACWAFSHFIMQWIWKQWVQAPQTNGQSSPGSLQSGQHPSKATRQIPHWKVHDYRVIQGKVS